MLHTTIQHSQPHTVLNATAHLNDIFRANPHMNKGHMFFTQHIANMDATEQTDILNKVYTFNNFTDDNDPYGEHDFGAFDYKGERYFFKIDYYDNTLQYASPDPTDNSVTMRVMTVMHASEY